MKKMNIAKLAAKIGKYAAVKAAGTASQFGFHQSKEPESLRKNK